LLPKLFVGLHDSVALKSLLDLRSNRHEQFVSILGSRYAGPLTQFVPFGEGTEHIIFVRELF
jgi:hypothetical protein